MLISIIGFLCCISHRVLIALIVHRNNDFRRFCFISDLDVKNLFSRIIEMPTELLFRSFAIITERFYLTRLFCCWFRVWRFKNSLYAEYTKYCHRNVANTSRKKNNMKNNKLQIELKHCFRLYISNSEHHDLHLLYCSLVFPDDLQIMSGNFSTLTTMLFILELAK